MKKLVYLLPLCLFFACQSPQRSDNFKAPYYDLKGYVDAQIISLSRTKPLVRKDVIVNEENETLITQKIDWSKELELFAQADINKPAFTQSYFVDTLSTHTISYRLRKGENLPVQYMEVITDAQGKLEKIKATLLDKNYLFESERILTLESKNGRLATYQIEGFQQLFIGEPKPFKVMAIVQ